ncbi:MAG: ADOP family duplicated permease [Gemmatimonadaceae bacterium]
MDFHRSLYVVRQGIRDLFRRQRIERELNDEIGYHLERETALRIEGGESPEAARSAALRDFGGVEFHKDYARDARRTQWADSLVRDVRFAVRSLSRAPSFTIVVIATLALGIGANSAVFSIVDAVLLHPLGVDRPAELVAITEAITDRLPREPLSYPTYRAMADRARSFIGVAAFATQDAVIDAGKGEPEQLSTTAASGSYFSVLGLHAQVGRLLGPGDDDTPGAHPVVVLSDGFWTRVYNRNSAVVGSTMKIGNSPYTIIGVAPRGFRGTLLTESPQLWVPATMLADLGLGGFLSASHRSNLFTLRNFHYWRLVGRLRDGRAVAAATAELNGIFAQEKALRPTKSPSSMGFAGREVDDPIRLMSLNDAAAWSDRATLVRFLWILTTVVVLTLLIASFNVANLFLVRGGERGLELSLRASLGASRGRIVQQLGVESMLLGLAGAAAGVLISRAGVRLLASFTLPGGIRLAEIPFALNGRVLGGTIALGVITALIFGLGPAIQASRASLISALRKTQPSSGLGTRALLLGGEVALSIMLLVGAGLFVRTMQAGLRSDLGFNPALLAAVRVNPALGGYKGSELSSYYRTVTERASRIPGVTGVALSTHVPLASINPLPFVAGEKAAAPSLGTDDQTSAGWVFISPNYFDVLQVPVIDGRAFTPDDTARAFSTAIINQSMAKALFPDGHPLGRVMVHAGSMRFTIVGVVRDTKYVSVQDQHVPMIFTPMTPDFSDDVQFIVRSERPSASLAELRRIVSTTSPRPPVRDARLVADQIGAALEPQRFGATLLGAYSLLGLLIASVGVYGLVAYIVAQQRREIGIRIALGAQAGQIVELVTFRIAAAIAVGVVIGLVAAAVASRALAGFLYGVDPTDVPTFMGAAVALIVSALAACVLPARRALRMDPALAMRLE